jgi:hypothetical protein
MEMTGGPMVFDPLSVGWWVEAADEELYGPISRETLRRFLSEGVVSPNTLVRHTSQPEAVPLADQPGMTAGVALTGRSPATGDRLADAWPRKWADKQALAAGPVPCVWHKRPAISYCIRCLAPYCYKCQQKPINKSFFFCRHCQANNHNRRFVALIIDGLVFVQVPVVAVAVATGTEGLELLVNCAGAAAMLVRDSLFGGAGPGKRVTGLRVVQVKDGTSAPTHGQGALRWLSQYIPLYNLFDAFAPLRDPLQRRYGDRWAGTRVIDSDAKLTKARAKVQNALARKGITMAPPAGA